MIEIDGVRLELEGPITEAGDYISDEYLVLIDLSTAPDSHGQANARRIASAIRRLNRNLATTSTILVGTELADPYNRVVDQLNEINAGIDSTEPLQPLITDESRYQGYSGSFRWAA